MTTRLGTSNPQHQAPAPLPDGPRLSDRVRLIGNAASIVANVGVERVLRRKVRDPLVTPPTLEALTPAWVSRAVFGDASDAVVRSLTWSDTVHGTNSRSRLHLELGNGSEARGRPSTLFVKANPSVATRVANGLSHTAVAEAGVYRDLRPHEFAEAPVGYYSSVDARSHRAIHLLEDLSDSKGATFCNADGTTVTREMADSMVDNLAALHTAPAAARAVQTPQPWLRTYREWWRRAILIADIRRFHGKGLREATEHVAPQMQGKVNKSWEAFIRSVHQHAELPPTVIHGDVHLGNWYQTGDGVMGLCDWQCAAIGHWSRDLAYALVTACEVEDRRTWEQDLVARHSEQMRRAGHTLTDQEAFDLYRGQIVGALLMWTPTYSPPPLFPDMQPRSVAAKMVHRITTAMADLDSLEVR